MRQYKTPEERLLASIFDEEYQKQITDQRRRQAMLSAKRLAKLLSLNAPAIIVGREIDILRSRLLEWLSWKPGDHLQAVCLICGEDYEKTKAELSQDV